MIVRNHLTLAILDIVLFTSNSLCTMIKKAIFPVAGFGTRFLPATKAQPKEMLPIVDKPIIQYLVEEAVDAGIENIIFVTGRNKSSIENHFDYSLELDSKLMTSNKHELASIVKNIADMAHFAYVRQPIQNGDGGALLCAKPFVDDDESVIVIFPDYLMPYKNQTLKKMISFYNNNKQPVIATDRVEHKYLNQYGVVAFESTPQDDIVKINSFVEKPLQHNAPSNLINVGYAILTPELYSVLENSNSKTLDGEIRLADAFIDYLSMGKELFGLVPEQSGYDCGLKSGFLKATVDYALEREDLREEFFTFLKKRIDSHEH